MKLNFKQEIVLVKELVWEISKLLRHCNIALQEEESNCFRPHSKLGIMQVVRSFFSLFTGLMIIDEGLL